MIPDGLASRRFHSRKPPTPFPSLCYSASRNQRSSHHCLGRRFSNASPRLSSSTLIAGIYESDSERANHSSSSISLSLSVLDLFAVCSAPTGLPSPRIARSCIFLTAAGCCVRKSFSSSTLNDGRHKRRARQALFSIRIRKTAKAVLISFPYMENIIKNANFI